MACENRRDETSGGGARKVERVHPGRPTSDGAGVRLVRLLGSDLQRRLDPFLMLDFFGSDRPEDYLAGFPTHPHRGFETLTLILEGRMRHRDSAGHEGVIEAGGAQWMTAGRGVLHSEMPEQTDGRLAGFQLWINLPAREKDAPASYRDLADRDIPRVRDPVSGAEIRVIAGRSGGVRGPVERPATDPFVLDVRLPPRARFFQPLPNGHRAFLAPWAGRLAVDGVFLPVPSLAVLEDRAEREGVEITSGSEGGRGLLVAGRPLGEPVVQYGPFVMTSEEEIRETLREIRSGRFPPP